MDGTGLKTLNYFNYYVRFEGFTAVTMKNGVFWDVKPCGSVLESTFRRTLALPSSG
jgi:hypothetical protein